MKTGNHKGLPQVCNDTGNEYSAYHSAANNETAWHSVYYETVFPHGDTQGITKLIKMVANGAGILFSIYDTQINANEDWKALTISHQSMNMAYRLRNKDGFWTIEIRLLSLDTETSLTL